ncbi:MAG: hypothetical protein AAGG75_16490 [Bacteroidota bacterium]
MYSRIFIPLLAILLSFSCNRQLEQSSPTALLGHQMHVEHIDGKCYAKILMPNQSKQRTHFLALYTGEPISSIYLDTFSLELKPASTKWVKKKSEEECLSPNPEDCMVWSMEDMPAEVKQWVVVNDTSAIRSFTIEKVSQKVFTKMGGYKQRVEVRCPEKIDGLFIRKVADVLHLNGFLRNPSKTAVDPEFQSALTRFQRANQLPIGHFDEETLMVLGI